MPEDYVRTVLIAGRAGAETVPILIDSDGRLIVTGGNWNNYTSILEWQGGTPTFITTKARWKKIGGVAFVNISVQAAVSDGAMLTTITLPEAVTTNVAYASFVCNVWVFYNGGQLILPQAALLIRSESSSKIQIIANEASDVNFPIIYSISGCYEVPT